MVRMISEVCAVRRGGIFYIPHIVQVFEKVLSFGNMSTSPDAVTDLHLNMTGLSFKFTPKCSNVARFCKRLI